MAGLDFSQKVDQAASKLESIEGMLGKGLLMPFKGSVAGARALMHNSHRDHIFPLISGEKAVIETGYEIRFGDYSSSITRADTNYNVVAKISKFSFAPNHHYWLIVQDINTKRLDLVERISYFPITESYGYLYNNEYLDTLNVGDLIPKDQIVQKSLAFDEYNNRTDGVNMNVAYFALDDNMEDSIIFSDVAAGKLTSPLVKPVEIMINDNDIPLNIYGDDKIYKVIPDIGEDIQNANLIALRREKKEESYFAQSVDRLKNITMSDDIKQVKGKVVDIYIYCNNPAILDGHYYSQLKMYYNEVKRANAEIVQVVLPYVAQGCELSYQLQKKFAIAKQVTNGDMYIGKRTFSNIVLNITVLEELKMGPGDKASNRFGGKGVISSIYPQAMMQRFTNSMGEYEYVDIIFNSSTMINRENVGQTFELSITHIGRWIIKHIKSNKLPLKESYNLVLKYIKFCSPQQGEMLEREVNNMTRDELIYFMEDIINSKEIHLSMRPLSDGMTIDKLNDLYKLFPFVEQDKVEVPLISSTGELRYIKARRPIVIGTQYILRLKQYAEDKFIATSLSATNIRNENIKSKSKKDFKDLYSNTPIKFGNMEINNMLHAGPEVVISNMMIHSLSPQGRRLVEQMYTGDPFSIDIKLDSDSKNRSAEIANTYLKTIGRRLCFYKQKKHIERITVCPIAFDHEPVEFPIMFVPEEKREGFDYIKDFNDRMEFLKKLKRNKNAECPIEIDGIDRNLF